MSSYAPKPSESPSKPSRKRSAPPAVASASASSSTTPNAKKGNYERKLGGATGAAKTLLSTAVHNAQTANATPPHPTPFARERENTPNRGAGGSSSDSAKRGAYVRPESTSSESSRCPSESTPTAATGRGEDREDPASARRQFEQQEDFISFGEEEVVEERHSPRYGPGSRTSAHKRKYEGVDDEKMEQGTQRLAKRERERSTPWCYEPGVDWDKCQGAIDMLNAETRAFISYISPTPIEHELRLWTIELIRRVIKGCWSDAQVECFGSVGTGLYLPGGDIDLVVLSPSMPSPPAKPSSSLLHRLASLLLTSSLAEPSSLLVIAKARVPIVKFVTRYGGFSVDISVNQKGGVDAAMRVRNLLEQHASRDQDWVEPGVPQKGKGKGKGREIEQEEEKEAAEPVDYGVARSLVLMVKAFLNQRGMNEVFTGGLGSYSIICLVISFLQLHPKIQTGQIHPARNIGLLFVEFLEYYGKHFNFNEAGISIKGRGGYFNKHNKGWFRPNQPYLLSIEDPNDPTNDVSGGSHNIIRVRQTIAGAFDSLTATLSHRASHFAAARNPSIVPLSSDSLPNADSDARSSPLRQSILGAVIGMSRAAINSREANVQLYEDGVLQSLLEKSDQGRFGGAGQGKKAMKRAYAQQKEADKREKTIAKLKRRTDEHELKVARKEKKKVELERSLAPKVETTRGGAGAAKGEERDDGPVARQLFQQNDGEDSRYSIATPGPGPASVAAKAAEVVYIDDSDEDSSADSHDDADVVIGGSHGGDKLAGGPPKKKQKTTPDVIVLEDEDDDDDRDSSASSDGSSEFVAQALVRPKAETLVRLREPQEEPLVGLGGSQEAQEAAKASRKAEKAAFWAKKGPKADTITIDSDSD